MARFAINGKGFTLSRSIKMVRWFYDYCASSDYSIEDVYGTCSSAKYRAENYIKDFMEAMEKNGFECEDYRIISHNTMVFTAGYTLKNEDGIKFFVVETPNYRYCCPLEWLKANC